MFYHEALVDEFLESRIRTCCRDGIGFLKNHFPAHDLPLPLGHLQTRGLGSAS